MISRPPRQLSCDDSDSAPLAARMSSSISTSSNDFPLSSQSYRNSIAFIFPLNSFSLCARRNARVALSGSSWRFMSFGDPPGKRPFDLVQLAQFIWEKRLCPVLRHQHAQLVLCVDAPGLGAAFDQRGFGGLVLTKENRFFKQL